jgi:hypothetical protein
MVAGESILRAVRALPSFHTFCLIYAASEIGRSQGRLAATPMFRPSADCAFPQKL